MVQELIHCLKTLWSLGLNAFELQVWFTEQLHPVISIVLPILLLRRRLQKEMRQSAGQRKDFVALNTYVSKFQFFPQDHSTCVLLLSLRYTFQTTFNVYLYAFKIILVLNSCTLFATASHISKSR